MASPWQARGNSTHVAIVNELLLELNLDRSDKDGALRQEGVLLGVVINTHTRGKGLTQKKDVKLLKLGRDLTGAVSGV